MPPRRVLLTGAAGFIGAHVLEQLLSCDLSVRAIVTSESDVERLRSAFPTAGPSQLDYAVVPDVLAPRAYDHVLASTLVPFDTVIHTECATQRLRHGTKSEIIKLAVHCRKNLLQNIKAVAPSVRRVIVTTTFAAVASWAESRARQEDGRKDSACSASGGDGLTSAQELVDICRNCKDLVEDSLWDFMDDEEPNFELVSLFAPSVYGPLKVLPRRMEELESGNLRLWQRFLNAGRGTPLPPDWISNYVDVRNLAFAHSQAAFIPQAADQRFEFRAGDLPSRTIRDILETRFPALVNRLPDTDPAVEPSNATTADSVDATASGVILGLVRYLDMETTLVDTTQSLLEMEDELEA